MEEEAADEARKVECRVAYFHSREEVAHLELTVLGFDIQVLEHHEAREDRLEDESEGALESDRALEFNRVFVREHDEALAVNVVLQIALFHIVL